MYTSRRELFYIILRVDSAFFLLFISSHDSHFGVLGSGFFFSLENFDLFRNKYVPGD
jgi:hypothetical protein